MADVTIRNVTDKLPTNPASISLGHPMDGCRNLQEVTMLKTWFARPKALVASAVLCCATVVPLLAATPADAAWGHGWGWHGGPWFRGGVVVGVPVPRVVIGAPIYAPAYPYPYAVGYRWIPPHYTRWGAFVPGHWAY